MRVEIFGSNSYGNHCHRECDEKILKGVNMPEIEIEVWCSCGEGLCRQTDVRGTAFTIEPCEVCLKKKYDEGYSDGYKDGESETKDKYETERE